MMEGVGVDSGWILCWTGRGLLLAGRGAGGTRGAQRRPTTPSVLPETGLEQSLGRVAGHLLIPVVHLTSEERTLLAAEGGPASLYG